MKSITKSNFGIIISLTTIILMLSILLQINVSANVLQNDIKLNYTVAFDPDDGKTGFDNFYRIPVSEGGKITDIPDNPRREGYLFKGWYSHLDEGGKPILWEFEKDTVRENTTLWAAWEQVCIVAFDPDDGKTGYKDFYQITVPVGGKITDIPENPKREGFIFKGWYSYMDEKGEPILWEFEKNTIQENTTLWAAWEQACIVAFDPDDGNTGYNDFYRITVPVGEKITDIPENPKREGYLFKGWYSYLDENDKPILWEFEKETVQENMTLWADWEQVFVVAFDPNDGKTVYDDFYRVIVPTGGRITDIPENPKREGYLFKGWYSHLDESGKPVLWGFEKETVQKNMTLWAAWEQVFIVEFDPNDGITGYDDFYRITVPAGGKITDIPENPRRKGYVFKGWYSYLDESGKPVLWEFEKEIVQENITLWAAWEQVFIVVFDPNDGKTTENDDFYRIEVPAGEKISDIPNDPKREGYVFKGWYSHLDKAGNKILWNFEINIVNKNITLWAAWEKDNGGGNLKETERGKIQPTQNNNTNNINNVNNGSRIQNDAPKTGDKNNICLWILYGITSFAIIIFIYRHIRKVRLDD